MALKEDEKQFGRKVLTAINYISRVGGTDAMVALGTVTSLINALQAAPNTIAGDTQQVANAIGRGLRQAVAVGILSESHGQTTISGLATAVYNQISDVVPSASFAQDLP